MEGLILKVEIPKYIRRIQLSKARKKKFYELGKKTPEKFLKNSQYEWKTTKVGKSNKTYLFDKKKEDFVCANPRSHGTPRYQIISGQALYSGNMSPIIRAKVFKEVKEEFRKHFKGIKSIKDYPVYIKLTFYDEFGKGDWDLDNRSYAYKKAIQDTMTSDGINILEDDSVRYVTSISSSFIPIENEEDRKLVIEVFKETNEEILNNKIYES